MSINEPTIEEFRQLLQRDQTGVMALSHQSKGNERINADINEALIQYRRFLSIIDTIDHEGPQCLVSSSEAMNIPRIAELSGTDKEDVIRFMASYHDFCNN